MKRVLILALFFIAKSVFPQGIIFQSQTSGVQSPPPQRTCGTDPVSQQYEAWVASLYPSLITGKGIQGGNNTQSIFNIPVVVHIIHNNEAVNNPTITTGNNLNAAQIIDQINILNKDYNGTNTDTTLIPAVFKPLLGKFQVNFCLAVVNPTGGIMAEPGIDRVNRIAMGWTAPPYSMAYCDATIKPASIWNVNKYLNIWVCPLSGGLLGYATFPDPVGSGLLGLSAPYGNATTDGVVIQNTGFGSVGTAATFVPYNKGRTTTHEIGHWIGLRHIWGDANCGNDFCNDTPTQQTNNFGCPVFPQVTCGNGPNGNMHMNYMDYTDDACMYMFTKDQKYRAQLILVNSPIRAALITSTVCNLPSIGNDIAINYVVTPTYSQIVNCSNKIIPVIRLDNLGSTTITSATVMYNCDGVNTQTVSWAGSLSPSATANYTLPQIINLVNGAHAFNATVTAPNGGVDNNPSNNYDNQLFSIANSFTLTANAPSICAGQTATLTGSGGAVSYSWNPGAIIGTTAAVSPTTTTIYTLTGTSGTCQNTYTTNVTISGSLNISVNNASICTGQTATLTASGAVTYTWNTGSNNASISITPTTTTVYTVSGTNGSCNGTTTSTVTVNTTPTVTVNSSVICSGNSAILTASGAATYSWSTGALTASVSVSPGGTTVYTVTGNNGTCANTKTTQVNVNPSPTVSVNNATICSGNNAVLTASGAVSYSWNTGALTASISVSPGGTTIYTVTGTSAGCTDTRTTQVGVTTTPTVTVNSATICSGNPAILTASGAATYSWSTGAVTASVSVAPGITTVYTVTGNNGACANTKTVQVNVNTSPTVSVNNATICSGSNVTLTANGAVSYSWNTGAVTSSIVVSPTATTNYTVVGTSAGCTDTRTTQVGVTTTPTVTVNSATICSGNPAILTASGAATYSWSTGAVTASVSVSPGGTTVYTVTGNNGVCANTKTVQVNVNITPTVGVNSATICSGNNALLTANGAVSFSWSTGALTNTVSVSPGGTTVYTVTGTSNGCTNTKTTQVNVNATPTLNINSATICPGSSVNLTANGATNYTWSTGSFANPIGVSPGITTVYTATGVTAGCFGTGSATVTIGTGLSVFINPSNQSICSGASATMTASGATNYTWSTGSNAVSIVVSPTTLATYSVIGATGSCTGSANSTVNISPAATITMNIVNATCNGLANGAATINASGGASPYTYSFSTGANSQSTGSLSANTYTAMVTTSIGCTSSIPFTISQPAPIAITSTITPATCGACNGSVTFTANGGTPSYNFTFLPGPSNTSLCAGSYTVFTTDANGCSGSAVTNVGSSSTLSSTATIVQPSCGGCNDGSVAINVVGGTGPYTYSWSPSVSTSSAATGLGDGCYTITVTDASLCANTTTFCLNGGAATGMNKNTISVGFNLYPNPSTGAITIEFGDKRTREISVLDVTGRKIMLQTSEENTMQLNLSPYANGVYFVRIIEDQSIKQVKVIKQ